MSINKLNLLKRFKSILSVIIFTVLLAAVTSATVFTVFPDSSVTCGDALNWSFNGETGTLIIDGTGDMYEYSDNSVLPWQEYASSILTVTVGDGVGRLSIPAFSSLPNLTSMTVGEANSLYSSDEKGVLYNKDKTTVIYYPMGIADAEFVIPDGVENIGAYAFSGCLNLTGVTIPGTVKSIGEYAFSGCPSLLEISMPDSVSAVSKNAFYNCRSLNSVYISSSVTRIEEYTFGNCHALANVNVPDSIEFIGDCAFSQCTSLKEVVLPDSVKSLGNYVFENCSSLEAVTIPDSVTETSMGMDVFHYYNSDTGYYAPLTDLTIKCYENSYAYTYASENGFRCELIEKPKAPETEGNASDTKDDAKGGKKGVANEEDYKDLIVIVSVTLVILIIAAASIVLITKSNKRK